MLAPIRKLAVGVGLLGRRDPVLNIGLGLAQELGAELHAVHVYDPPPPLEAAYARRTGAGLAAPAERAEGVARLLEGQLRQIGEYSRSVCHVVEGTPSEGLVQVAEEVQAELMLLGATRQDRVSRRFLGSTAQGVVSRAVAPVLLLRQPIIRPLKRVLLTTNLSEVSTTICPQGLELVRKLFAPDQPQVRCLLVVHQQPGTTLPLRSASLMGLAQEELARFLRENTPGLGEIQERIREGDAAEEIVREVARWSPDLLIVGNHGYAGRTLGIGNVTGEVLREVVCNTLVVPAAKAPRAFPVSEAGSRLQIALAPVAGSAGR